MSRDEQDEDDVIETLVRIASSLGMNPIRVRWKLARIQTQWRRLGRRTEQQVDHIRYEHKVCANCGSVQDRDATVCTKCGEKVSSRQWQLLERIGVSVPSVVSVSSLLGVAMLGVYARILLARPGGGLWTVDTELLYRLGGHVPSAVAAGQWWRLATAVFLHIGLWHLGFNLLALAQIGPPIEKTFGRGTMLFIFMLTGVIANVGSGLWGLAGISAGASGAIMGLIGVAAGWGHRDGTAIGKGIRNRMLKWAAYVMVFGFLIGADNAAHAVGFMAGGLLGLLIPTTWLKKSKTSATDVLVGLLGAGGAVTAIVLCLAPPASASDMAHFSVPMSRVREQFQPMLEICSLRDRGDRAEATRRLQGALGEDADDPTLDAYCAAFADLRVDCARYHESGTIPESKDDIPEDPTHKAMMESWWRDVCSVIAPRRN